MENVRISNFASNYFNKLHQLLKAVDPAVFDRIVEQLERTRKAGSVIYLIGNGGSASIASHMANDMGVGIRRDGVEPLKILSLTDNVSTISALGNDMGYDSIFTEQLRPILHKDDLLIAMSVSGNSPNIIKAVEFARNLGVVTIGWSGFDGGQLKGLCDISFHIENEKGYYGPPEDAFMILDHLIYTYYKFEHYKD
jgi:D-sedoheptulose 7-phosphate isomerase